MKLLLPFLSVLCVSFLSACAGKNENAMSGARISAPYISDEVDAHLALKNRVSGSATVETYQILFVKFNVGGEETLTGNTGAVPRLKETIPLNPFEFLVKSPADRQGAVNAACYNAVENGNCDAIVNTRLQLQTTGFSVLGLFGHGTASATVDAIGLQVSKGQPKSSAASRKSKTFLQQLLGDLAATDSEGRAASRTTNRKAVPAKESPAFHHDASGTAYLASAVRTGAGQF